MIFTHESIESWLVSLGHVKLDVADPIAIRAMSRKRPVKYQ
jgi:hypothetical protein